MTASSYVHLEVERVLQETDWALLLRFKLDDSVHEAWIPKSQIADPHDYEEGDEDCEISVTKWIMQKRGFSVED